MAALVEQSEYERIGSLDGLRAIAILLVLLHHFVTGGDSNRGLRSIVYKVADAGWVGVDLFFVLSGFLITGILIRSRDLPNRFRNFYARRTLRIFPLYYLALAIAFLIVPVFLTCPHVPALDQLPYWLYVSNFRTHDIVSPCASVGHFWSLAIEEQYYAVWPAVVFLASPRNARRACIAIVALTLIERIALVTAHAEWRAYYWTPSRADALACGSFISFSFLTASGRRRLSQWSVPVVILTGALLASLAWRNRLDAIFVTEASHFTNVGRVVIPLLLALFFSALLVMSLQLEWLRRILDIAPFRFLARYSYGLYVWHMMIIAPVIALASALSIWPRAMIMSAASLLVAMLSYHLFEARFLALKRYFPQKHL